MLFLTRSLSLALGKTRVAAASTIMNAGRHDATVGFCDWLGAFRADFAAMVAAQQRVSLHIAPRRPKPAVRA